jgi:XTP/dITP diphosphohydrolase
MALIFVTGNHHKFKEVQKIAARHGLKIEMRDVSCKEIQADELGDISACSVGEACEILGKPCFVEDAGLFVRALRGFPGPYSNYVFRTIGNEGLLKLMAGVNDRRAEFRSAVGYCEPGLEPVVFEGRVRGKITRGERGKHGFGFDPIFLAKTNKTFAEMPTVEKNKHSHRAKAIEAFFRWYKQRKTV